MPQLSCSLQARPFPRCWELPGQAPHPFSHTGWYQPQGAACPAALARLNRSDSSSLSDLTPFPPPSGLTVGSNHQ